MCNREKSTSTKYKQNKQIALGHGITSNAPKKTLILSPNRVCRGCFKTMKLLHQYRILRLPRRISEGIKRIDKLNNDMYLSGSLIWWFIHGLLNYNSQFQVIIINKKHIHINLKNRSLQQQADMTNPQSRAPKSMQKIEKIQGMQKLEQAIKRIYDKSMPQQEIDRLGTQLSSELGYGIVYSAIRQKLQSVCKYQRKLIGNSVSMLSNKNLLYYRVNAPAHVQHHQQQSMKMTETVVRIIYCYYHSLAQSNQLICLLWNSLKSKQVISCRSSHSNTQSSPSSFSINVTTNVRIPQLKLASLNLLALKQLLPPSQHIRLTDFQPILQKLIKSTYVSQKSQIQEMLDLYHYSQSINPQPYNTSTTKEQTNIEFNCKLKCVNNIGQIQQKQQKVYDKKLFQLMEDKVLKNQNMQITFEDLNGSDFPLRVLQKQYNFLSEFMVVKKTQIIDCRISENKLKPQNQSPDIQINEEAVLAKKKKKNRKKKNRESNQKQKTQGSHNQNGKLSHPYNKPSINKLQQSKCIDTIKFLRQLKIQDNKRIACNLQSNFEQKCHMIICRYKNNA